LPCHGKTARQPIEFLFAESRVHFLAAIGALGAVDSGPHSAGGSKDTLVNLFRVQTAFGFQEETESVILVLFFLSLRADLDKIESHCLPVCRLKSLPNFPFGKFETSEMVLSQIIDNKATKA